jgi:hypothetical protein
MGNIMIIIVKNIKAGINIENVANYIKPAMKNRLFSKKMEIQSIKIVKLADKSRRTIEHHAIVTISNDPAKSVLNQLKSREKGNEQKIEEYVIRQWRNDRRIKVGELAARPDERRKEDRRRKSLKIRVVSEKPGAQDPSQGYLFEQAENLRPECSWDIVPQRRSSN